MKKCIFQGWPWNHNQCMSIPPVWMELRNSYERDLFQRCTSQSRKSRKTDLWNQKTNDAGVMSWSLGMHLQRILARRSHIYLLPVGNIHIYIYIHIYKYINSKAINHKRHRLGTFTIWCALPLTSRGFLYIKPFSNTNLSGIFAHLDARIHSWNQVDTNGIPCCLGSKPNLRRSLKHKMCSRTEVRYTLAN